MIEALYKFLSFNLSKLINTYFFIYKKKTKIVKLSKEGDVEEEMVIFLLFYLQKKRNKKR